MTDYPTPDDNADESTAQNSTAAPDASTPERAGLDPDAHDTSDPASPAATVQTVTNDAVAGEQVTGGPASVPTAAEAAPTVDAGEPADDRYLAPTHESSEEIVLDDSAESRSEAEAASGDER